MYSGLSFVYVLILNGGFVCTNLHWEKIINLPNAKNVIDIPIIRLNRRQNL